ncbi:MAG: DNA-processing protein DprA [Alphaproteobacteria bacterium]|nr:DNA-processing protein DprA [Alphaproteobacteria bacterium]
MDQEEKINRLRLFRSENVGAVTFRVLLEHFKTAENALNALPERARNGGRNKPLRIYTRDQAEKEFEDIQKAGAEFLFSGEDAYPEILAQMPDAPPVLSVIGNKSLLKKPHIAVVGTRNASANGKNMARHMASELVSAGYSVVSGLALGIDGAAHDGALYSANERASTTAVLGTGINVVYPEQNRRIYNQICEKGVIISEYVLNTKPQPSNFPQRNRIISGLSLGLVVIEAALRSGSLITANKALEQGKDVFAVPSSPLDPRAAGVNHLIKNGAPLVESAQDIIDHLNSFIPFTLSETPREPSRLQEQIKRSDQEPTDADRNELLSLLDEAPVEIDILIRETGLPASVISVLLVELELAGQIERLPGNKVIHITSL